MTEIDMNPNIQTAFVTGATGLLGNNLVRLLLSRGVQVTALARSRQKAERQFAGLPVEIVTGDMNNVSAFAERLRGSDVLFHTAAFFRDSFKGGRHWRELYDTNVRGTATSASCVRLRRSALRAYQLRRRSSRRTRVPAPRRKVPVPFPLAAVHELFARLTGKPALLSLSTARIMISERDRSPFDNTRSERQLGVRFRSVEETLRDTVDWYVENGWLQNDAARQATEIRTKAPAC